MSDLIDNEDASLDEVQLDGLTSNESLEADKEKQQLQNNHHCPKPTTPNPHICYTCHCVCAYDDSIPTDF